MDEHLTIVLEDRDLLSGICGPNDSHLRLLESALGGTIFCRGNELSLGGVEGDALRRFRIMVDRLCEAVRSGNAVSPEYVKALVDSFTSNPDLDGDPIKDTAIQIPHGFGKVFARTPNQASYIEAIRRHDIVFCLGPAGTGKTYLAVAEALREVLGKHRRKLVLTRPVVEAGESLGFLPGDLAQKINPYLKPLYDAMEALIPYELIKRMDESHQMEIAPLAYMRGRSLNDCVVILDEAQNTTKEQMKMFLTRIGEGSKAIITGDTTQVDLPKRAESGLVHAMGLLSAVPGISFSYLNTSDVVRNPLIKKIIEAYETEIL